MRGSILHPKPIAATLTGILFSGLVLFVVGLTVILVLRISPHGLAIDQEIPIDNALELPSIRGGVFLLDETRGKIIRIGTFDTVTTEATVSLHLSPHYRGRIDGEAHLWYGNYSTALPYVSFIGDAKIQEHWMDLGREAWTDPEMHRQLTLLMAEVPRVWWESDARFSPDQLLSSLMRDPRVRNRFDEMFGVLEPHLREGIHHVLWHQAASVEGTRGNVPNVKLIWAARRLIFGAQEPALTFFAKPANASHNVPTAIHVKEVF